MGAVLVNIVSEQILPTFLFVKHYKTIADKFLFISTAEMEKYEKTKALCEALQISKSERNKTLVNEDSLVDIIEKLKKLNLSTDNEYYVNLTGGTKIMSLALWKFFKNFDKTRFFYVPINKNCVYEIFEDRDCIETKFDISFCCEEYFTLMNIRAESEKLFFGCQHAKDIFINFAKRNFDIKSFPFEKIKQKWIDQNKQVYTKWFEEFVYYRIKEELNLSDNQIICSFKVIDKLEEKKIENYSVDNEIDVFFIKDNKPFIIECKISFGYESINFNAIKEAMYKLAAVRNRFGLATKATIFTLCNLNLLSEESIEQLKDNFKLLNLHYPIFDQNIIAYNFKEKLNEFVN